MRVALALVGALGLTASCEGRHTQPPGTGSGLASGGMAAVSAGGSAGEAGASEAGAAALGSAGEGGQLGSGGTSSGTGGARNRGGTGGRIAATGGSDSEAGQSGSGDSAGTGADGSGASGGSVATGGSGGTDAGGTNATAGTGPYGACGFYVATTLSPTIRTVASVEWSVNMATIDSASIEFGLDESYGLSAPVNLSAPGYRTLLLGMKALRDYHYRVVATGGGDTCTSPDLVLTTGALPNGLPSITVSTPQPDAAAGGYIESGVMTKGPAFILDADGDYVWWFGVGEMGRVQQSFDGKFMWYGNVNVHGGAGHVRRVDMAGTTEESFDEFGDSHHDFTVLPDETIGFIQHSGSCDRIMERAPDGSVREIINTHDAHGGTTMCHTNSIHYHPDDDSYTFSDLNQNTYVKVTRAGEVKWILGGSTSQFTGDGATWAREHGHQLLAPDRLLFFNNNKTGSPSLAVEVKLDFDTLTATRTWSYEGGPSSMIYGDVQRLDNGNTVVTYSTSGVIHEVDPAGNLVQSLKFDVGGAIGYVVKRASLYGPPPER